MTRQLVCALVAIAGLTAACSRNPNERTMAMPTSPSAVAAGGALGDGGVSGPAVVNLPSRADGVAFRADLENKYVSMGRRPAQVYVDAEGEAAWIGEYYRYRVNG